MAGAGESIGRDMGEKIGADGKSSQVICNGTSAGVKCPKHGVKNCRISELTGDETTASIGDQKEGELKRKGINLTTFKAKRPIG